MPDEKHPYDPTESVPIPTYEEATSSRTASARLGASEISSDAERQGLLAPQLSTVVEPSSRRRNGYYQPPSVQSVRSSEDSLDGIADVNSDGPEEEAELRREIDQMDIDDEEAADSAAARRRRQRQRKWNAFSQRIAGFTAGLSKFSMPSFRIPWPSFGWLMERMRIPSIPDRYRPSWPILARLAGLGIIITVLYFLFATEMFPGLGRNPFQERKNPEWVRQVALGSIDTNRIIDYTQRVTEYDHVAGTKGSYTLAKYMESQFLASEMDQVLMEEYNVYLNYAERQGRRVSIVDPPEMAWEAQIEEAAVYDEGNSHSSQQTWAYHGLSKSGSAKGPLIYANYGSKTDFKALADSHIDVEGSIVIMRQGGSVTSQAAKVFNAQSRGAIGALIYSDPQDDKPEGSPMDERLDDWKRPGDSVQRGTAALASRILGDVLTPNEPSLKSARRLSKEDNAALPKIPSLPLSWHDAQKLLQVLKGHGQELEPEHEFIGAVPDVDVWWTGDQTSPIVAIENILTEVDQQPIHDVVGIIQGIETSSQKLIVGNHRDSWCFGAADPGSGSAVMLEVMRVLGVLRKKGWRPLRSIIFASWDAQEYNMIGSTEFVEGHINDFRSTAIAYLNVGSGVTGSSFHASGSPLLQQALLKSLNRVGDTHLNKTFSEIWQDKGQRVEPPVATNDAAAFQFLSGMPTLDFGFSGAPVPLHSCYETFEWFSRHLPNSFDYQRSLVEIWLLLILELSQEPIVTLNFRDYSKSIEEYVNSLEEFGNANGAPWEGNDDGVKFDVGPLLEAGGQFHKQADEFQRWENHWYSRLVSSNGFESNAMAIHRVTHNAKAIAFETDLLDLPDGAAEDGMQYGIPGRNQYKHILFAPDRDDPGKASFFPFVRDAIIDGNWTLAQAEVEKAAKILRRASENLVR